MRVDERLQELDINLPEPPKRVGNNVGGVLVGNLLFMSGCVPLNPDGSIVSGKVGLNLSVDQAYQAAHLAGLNMLADIRAILGDLNRVIRVVKILGLVNAVPDFQQHPQVINGFSDLMVDVFGDCGRGARSAMGAGSLPYQAVVEIEIILEVKL